MRIENEFTVAQPVEPLWAYLLDVEKIAPCMPGAELTEHVDDTHLEGEGQRRVRTGEALVRRARCTIEERDDDAHRVTLAAKGMEAKGKGAARRTSPRGSSRSTPAPPPSTCRPTSR